MKSTAAEPSRKGRGVGRKGRGQANGTVAGQGQADNGQAVLPKDSGLADAIMAKSAGPAGEHRSAAAASLMMHLGSAMAIEELETAIQHSWRLGVLGKGHFFSMAGADVAGDFYFLSLGHVGKGALAWKVEFSEVGHDCFLRMGVAASESLIWIHGHDLLNPGPCKGVLVELIVS
jgi:hypothetical protein